MWTDNVLIKDKLASLVSYTMYLNHDWFDIELYNNLYTRLYSNCVSEYR
jgi:hypothetical protein